MNTKKQTVMVFSEIQDHTTTHLANMLKNEYEVKECYAYAGSAPSFLKRWKKFAKVFLSTVKTHNVTKVLLYGKSLMSVWVIIALIKFRRLPVEIILFRYDFEYFWMDFPEITKKIGDWFTFFIERYCLTRADKIVHKGLIDEFDRLPYGKKLQQKKHYLFREFVLPQQAKQLPKLSKQDGECHLIYAGGFTTVNTPFAESIFDFYSRVTKQHVHFHVHSRFNEAQTNRLADIGKKDHFFHNEGLVPHDRLLDELTKYDYGVSIHTYDRTGRGNNHYVETCFANKYFDYMAAGLPLISLSEVTATAQFIDENNIGFHFPTKDLSKLGELLKQHQKHYATYVANIKKTLKKFESPTRFLAFIKS